MVSIPSVAESNTKLYIGICGGIPLIGGFMFIQGWMMNIGDNPAYNISYAFSMTGGFHNEINETFSGDEPQIPPQSAMGVLTNASGFGPVTITFSVSASNADNMTKVVKGFQLGKYTFLSVPILRLFTFALMLRLFVYWGQNQSNFPGYRGKIT